MGSAVGPEPRRGYLEESRDLAFSFLAVIPLLVIYEVGILLTGSDVVNAVAGVVKVVLVRVFPGHAFAVFNLVVIGGFFVAWSRYRSGTGMWMETYTLLLLESLVYALVPGIAVRFALGKLGLLAAGTGGGIVNDVFLSIGAGVYEELFFRFILITVLCSTLTDLLRLKATAAALVAIVLAALAFAAAHHVGALGETFTRTAFTYRFLAGLILSAIFVFRGLGMAVYTHVFYDLLLVLER